MCLSTDIWHTYHQHVAVHRERATYDTYHRFVWLIGVGVPATHDFAAVDAPTDDAGTVLAEDRASTAEARTRAEHLEQPIARRAVACLGGCVTALDCELADARRESAAVYALLGRARAVLAAARAAAAPRRARRSGSYRPRRGHGAARRTRCR